MNQTPTSEAYNMDCMEYMKGIPDKWFDLAVVDPPYGIGEDGSKNHTRSGIRTGPKFKGGRAFVSARNYKPYDGGDIVPDTAVFDEIIRVSKNQIFFGANHFISRIPYDSPGWIVWDKKNEYTDFADCELAWTSFRRGVKKYEIKWAGFLQENMKVREVRIHPNHKPVRLYGEIFKDYARPGQRILDTHLGSGSSRIAAYDMGFDFVGCELDPDYFAAQEKRFAEHIAKPVLFAPAEMYPEQGQLFNP